MSLFVVPGWDSWYNNPKILTGSVPGKFAARLVPGRARKNFLAKIQGSPHKLDLDCRENRLSTSVDYYKGTLCL